MLKKMTVTDHVLSAIESTLLKTPANYPYQEELQKKFLSTAGQRSWQQEDIFAREPVRQTIIALNTNNAFLGTNRTNPFHYQKFGLEQATLRRNGLPIASTPISTQDHKRLFFNTLSALGLLHCGLGITLDNYQQHFKCVLISIAHSRQLMTSCIQNLVTAQFHSIFNSQTL